MADDKKEPKAGETGMKPEPKAIGVTEGSDAPSWFAKMANGIATPLVWLGVGLAAFVGGVEALFVSNAVASLGNLVLEGMTTIGLLSAIAIQEVQQRWPAFRRFLCRLMFWTAVFVVVFTSIAFCCAMAGWKSAAIIFALLAVLVPYLTAWVIQISVGRVYGAIRYGGNEMERLKMRRLGVDMARPLAAFCVVTTFVALMVFSLPTPLRHGQLAVAFAGMLALGSSYLLLLGRKSNRAYQLMYVFGILITATMLVWNYLLPTEFQNLVTTGADAAKSAAKELTDKVAVLNLKERVVIQNVTLLGKATEQYAIVADTQLLVNYDDSYPGNDSVVPAHAVYDSSTGVLVKLGYVQDTFLRSLKPAVKPAVVATASASEPTPPPIIPAKNIASPEPNGKDEAMITAITGEWEEIPPSPIVPQAGDMVVLGPLKNPKEFARIESIVGLNSDEAVIAKVFDDPAGGFIAKRGVTRSNHEPMRFRILDGDPISVNVRIERGEFARYQAQTRKEAS